MLTFKLDDHSDLRLLLPQHAEVYSALVMQDHEDLGHWLPWATADYDLKTAQNFIKNWLQKLADNNGMMLAMFYEDRFAGWINYHYWNWRARRTELGYWLGVEFRGKGLVTRAVTALTDYAIFTLNLNRIEIMTDPANTRSSAVPLRLHFIFEGTRAQWETKPDGDPMNVNCYYMLAEQWRAFRATGK